MNRHFLAITLWVIAAIVLAFGYSKTADLFKHRERQAAAVTALTTAFLAAVFANAGADLW